MVLYLYVFDSWQGWLCRFLVNGGSIQWVILGQMVIHIDHKKGWISTSKYDKQIEKIHFRKTSWTWGKEFIPQIQKRIENSSMQKILNSAYQRPTRNKEKGRKGQEVWIVSEESQEKHVWRNKGAICVEFYWGWGGGLRGRQKIVH